MTTTDTTPETDQQQQQAPAGDQQQQAPAGTKQPASIPYTRFQEVNTKLAEAQRQLETLQQQQNGKQTEDAKLAERLQTLESDLANERAQALRLRVAAAVGLPAELVDRLRGSTEAEIKADAEALAGVVSKRGPGVPPPGARREKVDIKGMSPKEIREARRSGQLL